MTNIPWMLITVLSLLILFGIIAFLYKNKKKSPIDYYNFFIMGIIWAGAGVPLKNYALSAMGIIFLIVGLVNKDKWKKNHKTWKQLTEEEKKIKYVVLIGLGMLVVLGLVLFLMMAMKE